MSFEDKKIIKQRRRLRIRKNVLGTVSRPRLSLHFSGKHIYAQCIDDDHGRTLVYRSTVVKNEVSAIKPNTDGAIAFGKIFGEAALKVGVVNVVFDRGTKRYHGKVKAFADSVRSVGVRF
ncbi:MAG: 50S ribosomal protein L18 [Puniceicoccales bacterium]|jgi:large subunit ribosomal protein L18|nr:50S ribosomal protein L18 [Puniceicoccales bacterium]